MSKELIKLAHSSKTVFTFAEIYAEMDEKISDAYKRRKIDIYQKKWLIHRLTSGLYWLHEREVNPFELVNKMYSPSYISFYSALYYHKIIFQYPEKVFIAGSRTFEKEVMNISYASKRLKEWLLFDLRWIQDTGTFMIASPERAFLDTLYLYWEIYFDNLSWLSWEKIQSLLPMYTKKLSKTVLLYKEQIWMQ